MDTNDESTSPRQVALTEGLGLVAKAPTDWCAMTTHALAMRFDCSAAWLLRGECFDGPKVGAGAYLEAATRLRSMADEIERLTRERDEWAARWHAERKKYAALRWPDLTGTVHALGPNVLSTSR